MHFFFNYLTVLNSVCIVRDSGLRPQNAGEMYGKIEVDSYGSQFWKGRRF